MQYTAQYLDEMLLQADQVGKNQRELANISEQLAELVSNGAYKLRRKFSQPLSDEVLRPFCLANHVTVKVRMNNDIQHGILSYEYTFIFIPGDDYCD